MTEGQPTYLDKIVNADLARTALHNVEPFGEFTAYVRLASPEKCPSYMEALEFQLHMPGYLKVRIPCAEIARVAGDSNVLSVELREHISSGGMS
jgi:hypothetical protein